MLTSLFRTLKVCSFSILYSRVVHKVHTSRVKSKSWEWKGAVENVQDPAKHLQQSFYTVTWRQDVWLKHSKSQRKNMERQCKVATVEDGTCVQGLRGVGVDQDRMEQTLNLTLAWVVWQNPVSKSQGLGGNC